MLDTEDKFRIRHFQASDLPSLIQIDQSCFPPGISYSREELAGYISHLSSMTWVAEAGGAAVGFVVASRQPARVGHIITLDVVKAWRRHGVGKALMESAEKWARQAKLELMYLETAESNLDAIIFYEEQGYQRVQKVERYYSRNLAAWVMVKHLR
jgi:[ribosomal protein S18]-alanine N-acetyltransferase